MSSRPPAVGVPDLPSWAQRAIDALRVPSAEARHRHRQARGGGGASVGTVVGASTCVDGYLDGVEGYSGFAFALVATDDGPRIESWRSGQCR